MTDPEAGLDELLIELCIDDRFSVIRFILPTRDSFQKFNSQTLVFIQKKLS